MNKSIILNSRPDGLPTKENFLLKTERIPKIVQGEILLKALYVSVDPYIRGRMNDVKSYVPPFEVGKPMQSVVVAEVVESKNKGYSVGTHLTGMMEWKKYQVSNGVGLFQVSSDLAPLSSYLGVLGVTD